MILSAVPEPPSSRSHPLPAAAVTPHPVFPLRSYLLAAFLRLPTSPSLPSPQPPWLQSSFPPSTSILSDTFLFLPFLPSLQKQTNTPNCPTMASQSLQAAPSFLAFLLGECVNLEVILPRL